MGTCLTYLIELFPIYFDHRERIFEVRQDDIIAPRESHGLAESVKQGQARLLSDTYPVRR